MQARWITGRLATPVGIVGRFVNGPYSGAVPSVLGRVSAQAIGRTVLKGSQPVYRSAQSVSASGSRKGAFEDLIRSASQREGVDAQLVKAVVEAESNFNPKAVSSAGAKGLMQLMDGTARSLGVRNSFDPASNVAGGVKFLRGLLDRFHSVPLALAAYNAGPGAVEKYGGVPPYQETRTYVDRVLQLHRRNQTQAASASAQGGGKDGSA